MRLRELELSVTRSLTLKQELIEARDQLDVELSRYRVIQECSARALASRSLPEVSRLAAESAVEAFDTEIGVFAHIDDATSTAKILGYAGATTMREVFEVPPELLALNRSVLIREGPLLDTFVTGLADVMIAPWRDAAGRRAGVLAVGRTRARAAFFPPLTEEMISSFSILSQQVGSICNLLASRDVIHEISEAKRSRDAFLANISHEVRTPLNAIINIPDALIRLFDKARGARCASCNAEFVLDELEELPLNAECPSCLRPALEPLDTWTLGAAPSLFREQIAEVERAGRYLYSLFSDMLEASRLEAGRLDLALRTESLREILSNVRSACEPNARAKGVRLVFDAPDADRSIVVDPTRFAQVLVNLVSNAIKFSPEGRTVTVATTWSESQLVVDVTDEGPGIAREHAHLLFEPFRQLPLGNGRTEYGGGAGLGLSIADRLIKLHGGRIELDSEPGRGARFSVILPLADRTEEVTP